MNIPAITPRQLATILAALRYWQRTVPQDARECSDIATNDLTLAPLNDDEIDVLCERINVKG